MKLRAPSSPANPWPKVGGAPVQVAGSPNPNLLLWSEAFDNPVWEAAFVTVTANAALDPDEQEMTADRLTFGLERSLLQNSGIAAATGDPVSATPVLTTSWVRHDLSGVFDGTTYAYSVYLREETAGGRQVRILIKRLAGFLHAGFEDIGDEVEILADWAKLETPDLTAYVKREGT